MRITKLSNSERKPRTKSGENQDGGPKEMSDDFVKFIKPHVLKAKIKHASDPEGNKFLSFTSKSPAKYKVGDGGSSFNMYVNFSNPGKSIVQEGDRYPSFPVDITSLGYAFNIDSGIVHYYTFDGKMIAIPASYLTELICQMSGKDAVFKSLSPSPVAITEFGSVRFGFSSERGGQRYYLKEDDTEHYQIVHTTQPGIALIGSYHFAFFREDIFRALFRQFSPKGIFRERENFFMKSPDPNVFGGYYAGNRCQSTSINRKSYINARSDQEILNAGHELVPSDTELIFTYTEIEPGNDNEDKEKGKDPHEEEDKKEDLNNEETEPEEEKKENNEPKQKEKKIKSSESENKAVETGIGKNEKKTPAKNTSNKIIKQGTGSKK